jgi:hypothetical protein
MLLLALALTLTTELTPTELRVTFQNTGSNLLSLPIGGATGLGQAYNLELTGHGPGQTSCPLLDATVGFVAGYVEPIVLHLRPGQRETITIARSKLHCATKIKVPFTTVTAVFEGVKSLPLTPPVRPRQTGATGYHPKP